MTHTAKSERKAVFALLATWRTVNYGQPPVVHAAGAREHADGEARRRPEEQKRPHQHERGGLPELEIELHQAVLHKRDVGPRQKRACRHEPREAHPGVAYGERSLRACAESRSISRKRRMDSVLNSATTAKMHAKHASVCTRASGEKTNRYLRHGDAEQPRRQKRQPLRQGDARNQAHRQRRAAHARRLHEHDGRGLPRAHAQKQIRAEFGLAPTHEEAVGVDHQKAQHAGDEHREHPQEAPGELEPSPTPRCPSRSGSTVPARN